MTAISEKCTEKNTNLSTTSSRTFTTNDLEADCIAQMNSHGFRNVPQPLNLSGTLVKFDGRLVGEKTEWYKASIKPGNKLVVTYNSFHVPSLKREKNYVSVSGSNKHLGDVELESQKERVAKMQQERLLNENKDEKKLQKKAVKAQERFNKASETGTSKYLERKRVGAYGIRFERQGNETIILVPMIGKDRKIGALQEIHETKKLFFEEKKPRDKHFTNATKGLFHVIGSPIDGQDIRISEGYATAASCYESSGCTIPHVVAFSAEYYKTIVPIIRELYPNSRLIICADNNIYDNSNKKNTGLEKAMETAKNVDNSVVVYPKFPPEKSQYEKDGNIEYYADFNDLMILSGKEEVERQIEQGIDGYKNALSNLPNSINHKITSEDVIEGLKRNERGDAELFLKIRKDTYVFDGSEGRNGEFYHWTGSHWELDSKKQRYRDMELVAKCYEEASIEKMKAQDQAEISKLLSKRAYDLRGAKRCKSIFEFIAPEIHFSGEWDYCQRKLPCSNGIVDLETGKLLENKPEYFVRSICPTRYNPDAKSPLFDQFINDITEGDYELKCFIQRLLGAILTGNCKEEIVIYLWGENGRNGKGTLMQTLENVLGPFARTFPSEMLLLQRNPPSSSTPRPEKANLQGVRFAIFSEINKGRKIDSSEVKNLSGNDTITGRRLFSNKHFQFRPSHTMILQTNFKPEAPPDDGALWKRNILIPFKAEFVDEPKEPHQYKIDRELKKKLLNESEGILCWLVEGAIEYQRVGLNIPDSVQEETEKYRKENDGIGLFLSERCVEDPAWSTTKGKMEREIKDFCKNNGFIEPKRGEISTYLKARFPDKKESKANIWKGIKIVDENEFNVGE